METRTHPRRPPLRLPPQGLDLPGPRVPPYPEDLASMRQRLLSIERMLGELDRKYRISRQAWRMRARLDRMDNRLRRQVLLGEMGARRGHGLPRRKVLQPPRPRLPRPPRLLEPAVTASRRFRRVGGLTRLTPAGLGLTVLSELAFRSLGSLGAPRVPSVPALTGPVVRSLVRSLGGELVRQQAQVLAQSALLPTSLQPPTPILRTNTRGFGAALQRYWQVVGGDLATLLHQQTRRVTERCIDLTPPFSGKRLTRMLGGDFGRTTAKKIGENRVARDIERVFVPVDKLRVWKTYVGFLEAVERQDTEALQAMLAPKFHFESVAVHPDPAFHQRQRNHRGVVRRRPRQQLVLNRSALQQYIARRQKEVGYAKAGWSAAANRFGVKLPAWIARHKAPGFAEDLTAQEPIRTRIGNEVAYIQGKGRELKIMELAITGQEKALLSNMRRILKERSKTKA